MGRKHSIIVATTILCCSAAFGETSVPKLLDEAEEAWETQDLSSAGNYINRAHAAALNKGLDEEILVTELHLAHWCAASRRTTEAIRHIEAIYRRLNTASLSRAKRGILLNTTGRLNLLMRRYPSAAKDLHQALDLLAREYGFYYPTVSFTQGELGTAQLAGGNEKDAATNLREAATNLQQMHVIQGGTSFIINLRLKSSAYPNVVRYLSDYAHLLRRQDKRRYESRRLEELARLLRRMYGEDSHTLIPVSWRRGYNAEDRGYESSAEKHFLRAVELADQAQQTAAMRLAARQHLRAFYDRQHQTDKRNALNAKITRLSGPSAVSAESMAKLKQILFRYSFERIEPSTQN